MVESINPNLLIICYIWYVLDAPVMKKLSNKLIKLRNVTVPTNVSQRLSTFSREYFAVPQRANGSNDMGHII